ncbi:hypothetical protein COW99_01525 [Candidatus Roizmanbacteria bacterium CG22_combo_CG10-13_8_21_14_all_38_20]|uniref:AB hydrolase-1 domain-containing protein n=1 Tax=Candidatus Roizmanbacteria bacterium CG22_combo_CG10-13_8_21_14_all_38_20 TaxID=1974862 RepID=A0A2H0BW29_9BACT|nr:alpha/beta hydrolase [Candidatus Microgenomates bacterium]PIP61885.1 MAG: hypothetical protein COW99_01525 [Candidatus Roizmanbacteria bacterium CG22_combo_CG10-13_8_21_14_all_38_20]PJC32140.1 MAG: hypothetical protein CO050_01430 [Candidatus Roizmanbacteria bacterium CG_4_9_14_0_2_um_filter_38_17]
MNKGKTIVILHGWKLSSQRYNPLVKELRKLGYRVYIPDMPGNGVAKLPKNPFTLDDYVEYVLGYLSTNKLRRFTLIGHSFGGRVGIKLVAKNPELINKLVLTGTPGVIPVSSTKIKMFLVLAKIGNMIFNLPVLELFKDSARRGLYRLAKSSDYYHTDGVMRQTFKNIIRADLVKSMSKLKLPVTLVWGEHDEAVPVNVAKVMQKMIKGSKLVVIPGSSHDVIWANPLRFIDAFNTDK